jgi:hypothetical protein
MLLARILILGPTAPPGEPVPRPDPSPVGTRPRPKPAQPQSPNRIHYATHLV